MILAIDIGSTFINCVLANGRKFRTYKIFSSLPVSKESILKIIYALDLLDDFESGRLTIVHNSNEITRLFANENYSNFIFSDGNTPSYVSLLTRLSNTPALLFFNMSGNTVNGYLIDRGVTAGEKFIAVGGESVAFLDEHQQLKINPTSTDANHRSACYGFGDDRPTLTDANLMLGRLRPNTILGNTTRPDINSARMALAKLAGALNIRIEEAALAIINVANQKIVDELKALLNANYENSIPLTLAASGGCAGLHVCAIADALNIKNVIVPLFDGVFSAAELLLATDAALTLPNIAYQKTRASHHRTQLYGITLPVSIWQRSELSPEEMIMGPAIIVEGTSTLFLQNGWLAYVDESGHLLLRRMAIDVN